MLNAFLFLPSSRNSMLVCVCSTVNRSSDTGSELLIGESVKFPTEHAMSKSSNHDCQDRRTDDDDGCIPAPVSSADGPPKKHGMGVCAKALLTSCAQPIIFTA